MKPNVCSSRFDLHKSFRSNRTLYACITTIAADIEVSPSVDKRMLTNTEYIQQKKTIDYLTDKRCVRKKIQKLTFNFVVARYNIKLLRL